MPNEDLFADDFVVDPNKNYLEELVGEGKKFSSPEELARGKAEADAHIARIEAEQNRLRSDLNTRISLEEFLDQIRTNPPLPARSNDDEPHQREPGTDKSVTAEEIERLLEMKLSQKDQERRAQSNTNAVRQKLQETYGPSYAQHVKKQAEELGVSEQYIRDLAATSPSVLYRLLGIDKAKDDVFSAPPRSQSTNIPSVKGKGKSYYDKIYEEKPSEYWSPKIQNEIFERVKEIGIEAFNKS